MTSFDPSAPVDLRDIRVGDFALCQWTVTQSLIDAFAELSQDHNPLHMDEAFARARGFDGRVAHGMLALSGISRLIGTRLPGPGSLWISHDFQFVFPVLVDDRLEARVSVEKVSSGAQVVVLSTEVTKSESGVGVLRGLARVRIPPQRNEVGQAAEAAVRIQSTVEKARVADL